VNFIPVEDLGDSCARDSHDKNILHVCMHVLGTMLGLWFNRCREAMSLLSPVPDNNMDELLIHHGQSSLPGAS
jgi:hypothetical protein